MKVRIDIVDTRKRIMIGAALLGILLTASGCAQSRQQRYRRHLSHSIESINTSAPGNSMVQGRSEYLDEF